MSHKELFCELCCSILNTNSNIPKICSFICGEKLNKSNPGLINLKRYLIKRQIWHLADPPTVKKNVTTTEFWKPNTVVKLEMYKQPRAIENNFLLHKVIFFQWNPKIHRRKISRLKPLDILDNFYMVNLDYLSPNFFVA